MGLVLVKDFPLLSESFFDTFNRGLKWFWRCSHLFTTRCFSDLASSRRITQTSVSQPHRVASSREEFDTQASLTKHHTSSSPIAAGIAKHRECCHHNFIHKSFCVYHCKPKLWLARLNLRALL